MFRFAFYYFISSLLILKKKYHFIQSFPRIDRQPVYCRYIIVVWCSQSIIFYKDGSGFKMASRLLFFVLKWCITETRNISSFGMDGSHENGAVLFRLLPNENDTVDEEAECYQVLGNYVANSEYVRTFVSRLDT